MWTGEMALPFDLKCESGTYICDWILENHPYGRILHVKYLVLKSSLKIFFLFIYGSNAVKMLWITRKSVEIFKICFCDVSKIVVNSKILIISGTPIRVIFQNLVTYYELLVIVVCHCISGQQKFHNPYLLKKPLLYSCMF